MRIVAIIQARMGSTRLPGKVLKKVMDKTLLECQIERVKRSRFIDEIVVATTTAPKDQPIVDLCQSLRVSYFRGSEDDVLDRYYQAATHYQADVVVRLTSDCPLIDPNVVDRVIATYIENEFDYVSNTLERSYPRGMDTEVFSYKVLKEINGLKLDGAYREHVTPYIYKHPEKYRLKNVRYDKDVSHLRWTVDTKEDFLLISNIFKHLYPKNKHFTLEDILHTLEIFPEWNLINAHVKQKKMEI